MSKLLWSIKELPLPLKFVWKISRNSTDFKTNFLIEVRDHSTGIIGQGEVAFNIRYSETKEHILNEFHRFIDQYSMGRNLKQLDDFLLVKKFPSSLSFGIESALTHFLAKIEAKKNWQFLGLNKIDKIKTSFSIPILKDDLLENFYLVHNLSRFKCIKIKIASPDDFISINKLLTLTKNPIRIDANEAFENSKQVLTFCEKISEINRVEFIEQPLPSINTREQAVLKKSCPVLLAADESVVRGEIPDSFEKMFDIVNVKLMKAGSYQNAIAQLNKTRSLGLKTMLGCMVETSRGISSALYLAELVDIFDLDGFLFLKDEPFRLVEEKDGLLSLKEHC